MSSWARLEYDRPMSAERGASPLAAQLTPHGQRLGKQVQRLLLLAHVGVDSADDALRERLAMPLFPAARSARLVAVVERLLHVARLPVKAGKRIQFGDSLL